MRWVHKRTFAFLLSVLVPSAIGIGCLSAQTVQPIVEISATGKIHCFSDEMLLVLTTSDVVCPAEFVSLGDAPLTESRTATGEVIELNPLLSARFAMAQSFAEADGIKLTLTSGFRSLERQRMLFDREVAIRGSETEAAKWVLPPQFSHHPQGLAIDVNYPGDRAGALWLERNGARFGLCRVYANEWWHFEGVIAPGQRCPAMAPNALVDIE